MFKKSILLFIFVTFLAALLPAEERVKLWNGGEYPKAEQFSRFKNIRFVKVKAREPEKDKFVWQHGAAVIRFKGKWYASLGANAGHENTVGEKILITTSDDGIHWSPCKIIGDASAQDVGRSHGVFFENEGKLWAFHARFVKKGTPGAVGKIFPNLAMECYLLDESAGNWNDQGIVAKNIWFLCEPIKMDNGQWIVPGCDEDFRTVIATSEGNNFLKWNPVKIRNGDRAFSESNLWVHGQQLMVVIRDDNPLQKDFNRAAVSFSNDYGKTWSLPVESNMPMDNSKPYCGVLSTGQRYLINNLATITGIYNRSQLHIAVGKPGEETLSKVWTIRNIKEPTPEGAFSAANFSYPYAVEYDGNLYIIYSVGAIGVGGNNNHIEMAIIPIEELKD